MARIENFFYMTENQRLDFYDKIKDNNKLVDNDFRKNLPRYSGEYLENNKNLANEFALFAKEKNCTPAQLAISWVINQSDNIIPIPGTKRRKYLEENVNAVDVSLNLSDLEKIENILKKYPNIGPRYSQRENNFVKK